jgi:rubrerythrin
MGDNKDKTATTKDAGRQWTEDNGIDLRFRLVEELHELVKDEAEANAGYADILEHDNPYLEESDKKTIKAIIANEKDHADKLNAIIRRLDGIVADSNVAEISGKKDEPDAFLDGLGK